MSRYKPALDDEQMVGEALRALAEDGERNEAPPAIEARLRAAFRGDAESGEAVASSRGPASRSAAWKWIAAAATAAGLVWLAYSWRPSPIAGERRVESVPAAPLTAPVARALAPATSEPPVVAPPLQVAEARPVRTARTRRQPRVERFEPLFPGDLLADLDAVHVVRVSVPRSSLAALGWPARPGLGSRDRVELDAMVGPDGMARAVRFISQ